MATISLLMKDTKIYVKSVLDNLLISDRYQLCVKLVCLQIVKFCVEALARQDQLEGLVQDYWTKRAGLGVHENLFTMAFSTIFGKNAENVMVRQCGVTD